MYWIFNTGFICHFSEVKHLIINILFSSFKFLIGSTFLIFREVKFNFIASKQLWLFQQLLLKCFFFSLFPSFQILKMLHFCLSHLPFTSKFPIDGFSCTWPCYRHKVWHVWQLRDTDHMQAGCQCHLSSTMSPPVCCVQPAQHQSLSCHILLRALPQRRRSESTATAWEGNQLHVF